VDLFGQSLMDDLIDTTASTSRALPNVGTASLPEVDLFADTDFQSANAPLESATASRSQVYPGLMSSDFFTNSFYFTSLIVIYDLSYINMIDINFLMVKENNN